MISHDFDRKSLTLMFMRSHVDSNPYLDQAVACALRGIEISHAYVLVDC